MNPKIVFVASLFTSRIFWTQVIALGALVLTKAGFTLPLLDDAGQAELVTLLDALMTTVFRTTGPNGPVSITAPLSTPAPIEVPPGMTATVSAPMEAGGHPTVIVN
jgi:hypothetical protein